MNRYNRHIILSEIGQKGQKKISNAKVLVVGAGGLGCPVLQYLAAAGVGTLGIVDFDLVEESNLQRQILFGSSSLGKNKAMAAKERLIDLNPTIEILAYAEVLTTKNALELFGFYDIIVDGTDNFETRYLINDAAIISNKPVVYGAIYKFEGQVSVFNYQNGPSYRCLFPSPPEPGTVPNCSEVGVMGVLPGIIGAMQANEVLKMILGFDGVLNGQLLSYNAKTAKTQTLQFQKNENEFEAVLANKPNFINTDYGFQCHPEDEITLDDLSGMKNLQYIDVRELDEMPRLDIDNCIEIPLRQIEHRFREIDPQNKLILFCQSGVRSRAALSILKKHNINNCYSLKENIDNLVNYHKIKHHA